MHPCSASVDTIIITITFIDTYTRVLASLCRRGSKFSTTQCGRHDLNHTPPLRLLHSTIIHHSNTGQVRLVKCYIAATLAHKNKRVGRCKRARASARDSDDCTHREQQLLFTQWPLVLLLLLLLPQQVAREARAVLQPLKQARRRPQVSAVQSPESHQVPGCSRTAHNKHGQGHPTMQLVGEGGEPCTWVCLKVTPSERENTALSGRRVAAAPLLPEPAPPPAPPPALLLLRSAPSLPLPWAPPLRCLWLRLERDCFCCCCLGGWAPRCSTRTNKQHDSQPSPPHNAMLVCMYVCVCTLINTTRTAAGLGG